MKKEFVSEEEQELAEFKVDISQTLIRNVPLGIMYWGIIYAFNQMVKIVRGKKLLQ